MGFYLSGISSHFIPISPSPPSREMDMKKEKKGYNSSSQGSPSIWKGIPCVNLLEGIRVFLRRFRRASEANQADKAPACWLAGWLSWQTVTSGTEGNSHVPNRDRPKQHSLLGTVIGFCLPAKTHLYDYLLFFCLDRYSKDIIVTMQ